LITAQEYN